MRQHLKMILCALPLFAFQKSQASNQEELIELPEFRVVAERSISYAATNTLTGTQLNTLLRDTPFAIDVFTEAFLRDTGSTNFREALAFDSGVQLVNTISANQFGNYTLGIETDPRSINNAETDIVTRGFRAPTLKNGFFTQTRVDTINVARIERAGGPMSLLYGIGAITGVTNVLTKEPMEDGFTELETMVGSDNLLRFGLDTTGPVFADDRHFVGYRLTSAWQIEDSQFPFEERRSFFISPALSWSFNRTTDLRLELEHGDRRHSGNGPRDAIDSRAGVPSLATGVPSGLRQTDDEATFLEDYLDMGRYVNLGGPDLYTLDSVNTLFSQFTHRIGDHIRILLAGVYEEAERERLFLPGRPSIIRDITDPTGARVVFGMAETEDIRVTKQFRASVLYSLEGFGGRHNFVVGRQELSERTQSEDFPTSQAILQGRFANSIPADGRAIRNNSQTFVPPSWRDYDWRWYQGHYLIYQASLFNNRIHPVLGYRWDRTQTRKMRALYDANGNPGLQFDPLTGRNTLDGRDNNGVPFRQETPTLGASFTLHPAFSVYGVYSEGIALPNVAQRDGFGAGFPPEFTRNREVGFKLELWGGKLSGRMSYFNLQKTGGVRYSWYVPNPSRQNFDPTRPIVYEFPADTAANQQRLLDFLRHIGWQGAGVADFPTDIERRVQQIPNGGSRVVFAVPFGDPDSPGAFNPVTNKSDGGYGQNMRSFFMEQQALRDAGQPYNEISFLDGNNPSMDRGAYHNFNETSEGLEIRLNFTPIPNWQNVFSYTFTKVTVQSTFSNLAFNQVMTGIEPVFWILGADNFSDARDPNTYTGTLGAGVTNNDTPRHAFTYWSRYSFTEGFLDGFDVRLGIRYSSERAAESPWARSGGGFNDAVERGKGETIKAAVPAHTLFDLGMGYTWSWRTTEWTLQLNIRNLFDKRELRAETNNRLVEGLPVLTRFYLEPRDVRLSLRVDF